MPESVGLQLLPETRKRIDVYIPGQNRAVVLSVSVLVLVLVVGGVLFFLNRSVTADMESINSQLTALEKSRDTNQEKKLLQIKEQLATANTLLNTHIIWSNAFSRVQGHILPTVQFEQFSANMGKGEYVFQATADGFTSIAKQIAAFSTDDALLDVAVGQMQSSTTGRVSFSMILKLDTDKLIKAGTITPSMSK